MKKKSSRLSKKYKIIIFTIMVLFIVGIFIVTKRHKNTEKPNAPETVTYSTDTPDESKANADTYSWKGAENDPKKLRIQSIGVDAYVQRMGVDQNNKIAVPNNIHLTGWFTNSQQPGQDGLSIIAGHVTGKKGDGVFKHLGDMKAGDLFEVETGSGAIKHYKVIEVKQMKESESADYLFSQKPNTKSQLNLITCGGRFDSSAHMYDDRVIVVGELQE